MKVFSTDSAYAVYFKNFNRTVYAEITNISETDITKVEFAKIILKQAELFADVIDENAFMDIPFNEQLERYLKLYG